MQTKSIKKFLIITALLLIIAAGLLYEAPRLLLQGGRDLDIKVTDNAYISGIKKLNINITDNKATKNINPGTAVKNFNTKGTVNVDNSITSEEMSAIILKLNEKDGPIKDIKINFIGNGRGEVSLKLTNRAIEYIRDKGFFNNMKIPGLTMASRNTSYSNMNNYLATYVSSLTKNARVYARGSLTKESAKSIKVKIEELDIGSIAVPWKMKRKAEAKTIQYLNEMISPQNGFLIEELRVDDGKLYYKGTLPAEISSTAGTASN